MSNHEFPKILNIKDVEKAIDINCFFIGEKDGYQVVNYRFSSPEAFPDLASEDAHAATKREFRGLIFDTDGNLIRRPLHKFFNVGERLETHLANIDVAQPHLILEKLDGSMISPFLVKNKLLWGTKMGQTDVSEQVDAWLKVKDIHNQYEKFARMWIESGWTPIFEWVSNTQRIVLDYPQANLILTAMRFMHDGQYMDFDVMSYMAEKWKIPVVKTIEGSQLNEELLKNTKDLKDQEGFVIRFKDGQMFKIKSDWYCELHRVKSEINYERGVVALLLTDAMDDLKSMMPANDLSRIEAYETAFKHRFFECVKEILLTLTILHHREVSRKDFALGEAKKNEPWHNNIVFKLFDERAKPDTMKIMGMLNEIMMKNCGKNSNFAQMRKTRLFDGVPEWKPVMFDTDEIVSEE